MAQNLLFCFTNNSAKKLLHILGYNICIEHNILAHFCKMLLPLKASKIICAKAVWLFYQNVLVKLTQGPIMGLHSMLVTTFSIFNNQYFPDRLFF